ncbi:MAG: hypothetical protein SchgKO_20180 [Schleiferiaceae bacterium]
MIKRISLLLLLFIGSLSAEAQCAMCKAIAESNSQGGGDIASGLNSGIIYLMIFPYLIIGAVAYAFYRQRKAKTD